MDIVSWDLETTELRSDKAFILCAGFKPYGKQPYVLRLDDFQADHADPMDTLRDRRLVAAIRDELEKYDMWITWNGRMFDVLMLNDRLTLSRQRETIKKMHEDVMYRWRSGQSRFSSSRLDWVARMQKTKVDKTSLDWPTWQRATLEAQNGFKTKDAFEYIVKHNVADVKVLEEVYRLTKHRIRNLHV